MLVWPKDLTQLSIARNPDDSRVEFVAQRLGDLLLSGQLALFIGSGLSKTVNLPLCGELNKRIVNLAPRHLAARFPKLWTATLENELPKSEEMRRRGIDVLQLLDRVEQVCSLCQSLSENSAGDRKKYVGVAETWHSLVREALYQDMKNYDFKSLFHPELVSLCSLLVGGRRGLVREVVTFNYDDVIESYLRLHGHSYHVVTPLPNQSTPNYGTTFYHPHGYLPLEDIEFRDSSFLVLSRQSYVQVSASIKNHLKMWRSLLAWILCVRVGLFLGISGNDEIIDRYFDEALNLKQAEDNTPLAFAILVGKNYLDTEQWLRKGIIPLEFSNSTDVASFLTRVCQSAVEKTG
jgi:hypothetical protein